MKIEIPEGYEARINGNEVVLEPKENEDERIRKEIIRLIQGGGYVSTKVKEEMLSYLEKQKEQKSIEDVVKKITQNKETATKFLKSAGIMDENGELAEMYRSEQKPAKWNDDDEIWAHLILRELEKIKKDSPEYSRHFARLIDWFTCRFKSLRPQSKAKWSKEDEKMLSIAIYMVTNSKTFIYSGVTKFEVSDFLKSIKDKAQSISHWKPSKEQINALERAIIKMHTPNDIDILAELRDNLKKL